MATYPAGIWAPSIKVDNVDTILAAHMNDGQAEIVAVQTLLGTSPTANRIPKGNGASPLTWSADLTFDGTTFKTLAAHFLGSAGSPAGQVYIKSAAAGTIGLVVDTAASPTNSAQVWRVNGTDVLHVLATEAQTQLALDSRNLGNDVKGPLAYFGRNTNAGAVGPSAGEFVLLQANANEWAFWVDNAGKFRLNANSGPTGSSGVPTVSDTAGAIVGDQTSWHETKDILRQWDDPTKALEAVLATKVYDFRYKESSYLDADDQPAVFTGIVGFDRRDWFLKNVGRQQMPSLNEITILGYHTLSIQALHKRIAILEARVQ